jgi:hypothetical protein
MVFPEMWSPDGDFWAENESGNETTVAGKVVFSSFPEPSAPPLRTTA